MQRSLIHAILFQDSHCNVSSGASSQSLNRKSTSSLNSSLSQKDFLRKTGSAQYSPRQLPEQDTNMPQGQAIFKNIRGKKFPGKTECTDSGVGEDEVQEAAQDDFNFLEFSYFREMEIFHSAVNEKYVSIWKFLFAICFKLVTTFVDSSLWVIFRTRLKQRPPR